MGGAECELLEVQLHLGGAANAQRSSARAIRAMADAAFKDLDKRFDAIYAALGRPSPLTAHQRKYHRLKTTLKEEYPRPRDFDALKWPTLE
jgi:hypothetical protein